MPVGISGLDPKKKYGVPANTVGSAIQAATTPVSAQAAKSTSSNAGVPMPAYGSNVANFDPNNPTHVALADIGQAYATAKSKGDTAGMSAAAARGAEIRAGAGVPTTYDSKAGVTSFGMPQVKVDPPQVTQQPDYRAIAEAERAKYLADLQRIAEQQKAGLTRAFERGNQITRDNRLLGDFSRQQTANPFGNLGMKTFDEGLIGRERALTDESTLANYNAGISGIEQGLADDRNTAAQAIIARAYQLEQDAKQYGLDYAGLFGQLPGNGGSGGSPRTLAAQQQAYNQSADTRNYDRSVYESDRNYNFQKAQQDWENNFKQSQFDWQKAQQTWENAFQGRKFEQDMKEAAASRGLQWASLNQRQKEFVADQAFREKQFQFEQDKFSASQNGSKLSDKDSTDNFNMIFDDLQTQGVTKDKARQLLQANKGYLTDSDYAKLNSWINDNL